MKAVTQIFELDWLRTSNDQNRKGTLGINKARGFSRMLGSMDCICWRLTDCPATWHGKFSGHVHDPTSILQEVADRKLRIWHVYFGVDSSNDINMLRRSPLFTRLARQILHFHMWTESNEDGPHLWSNPQRNIILLYKYSSWKMTWLRVVEVPWATWLLVSWSCFYDKLCVVMMPLLCALLWKTAIWGQAKCSFFLKKIVIF